MADAVGDPRLVVPLDPDELRACVEGSLGGAPPGESHVFRRLRRRKKMGTRLRHAPIWLISLIDYPKESF